MSSFNSSKLIENLPTVRGRLIPNKVLANLSWLRVGGPAEVFFQPADVDDLTNFVGLLQTDIRLSVLGVCSNVIIRDGGISGVVVRLGKGFSDIKIQEDIIDAGASVLDSYLANKASKYGLDLSFLRTIPGTLGGALKMNAGCYGTYIEDVFVSAKILLRSGAIITMTADNLNFGYRKCNLPSEAIIISVKLRAPRLETKKIINKMKDNIALRSATQPIRERTCGSTFRNPSGKSSLGKNDQDDSLKAWKLITDAGLSGHAIGGAKISEVHSNFLINTGSALAEDFELLGELIQKKVLANSFYNLEWEVQRIGIRLIKDIKV